MVSNLCSQDGQNSGDNVFEGLPVGKEEAFLFPQFLASHDFSANSTRRTRGHGIVFRTSLAQFVYYFHSFHQFDNFAA